MWESLSLTKGNYWCLIMGEIIQWHFLASQWSSKSLTLFIYVQGGWSISTSTRMLHISSFLAQFQQNAFPWMVHAMVRYIPHLSLTWFELMLWHLFSVAFANDVSKKVCVFIMKTWILLKVLSQTVNTLLGHTDIFSQGDIFLFGGQFNWDLMRWLTNMAHWTQRQLPKLFQLLPLIDLMWSEIKVPLQIIWELSGMKGKTTTSNTDRPQTRSSIVAFKGNEIFIRNYY